jgi:hypothetical protein
MKGSFIKFFAVTTIACFAVTHQAMAHLLGSIVVKNHKPSLLIVLPMLVGSLFIVLATHELGHLVMGLAQGFRFELYVVGPLGIKRTSQGIKVYFNKNVGYMGGLAATLPTSVSSANRKKFAWVVLAGPLASLLLSVLCFLLFYFAAHGLFKVFMLMISASSVAIFLATTLPSKTGIFFTDHARFQRLISTGKASQIEEALLNIMAQYTIDNSCQNISIADAQLLQTDRERFMRFWGYYYEYQYYKDNQLTKQADHARQTLINEKSSIQAQVWKILQIDATAAPIEE